MFLFVYIAQHTNVKSPWESLCHLIAFSSACHFYDFLLPAPTLGLFISSCWHLLLATHSVLTQIQRVSGITTILGYLKQSLNIFYKMWWKNPNKIFGQPDIWYVRTRVIQFCLCSQKSSDKIEIRSCYIYGLCTATCSVIQALILNIVHSLHIW